MLNHKTIFLVEDDTDDQFFFINALEEIKDVTLFGVAMNGKEAIEKLQRSRTLPSMIFMDVDMPVMNGLECLRQLAKDPNLSLIPVVTLSSSTQYKDRAIGLGAAGFIEKSYSIDILRDSLEEMIDSETQVYS